ncbi:hypothetical protein KJ877_03760 [bacterium]|nr:hypothetical protein [bacterium]MBU1991231.1 hypothetical protein [bacterium]
MMQEQSYDIPLHDIKPIVEVQEYSLYYFLGLSLLACILACGMLYILYKWFKRRKVFNIRKEHKRLLSEISFGDAKKSAYAITLYGATFKEDSPRHVEMFANLSSRLQEYKYKKEVEAIDKETLGYFELYKEMCDV